MLDEFDPFMFENKVRMMVMELISPTTRRMAEMQESMEEIFRHDMVHQKRIDDMEFNWSTLQSKLALIDESYKTSIDMKENNKIFESEISQKIQSVTGNVLVAVHKVEDLNLKILNIDENVRTYRTEISEYANTVKSLKGAIIEEQNNLVRFVEKQVAEMKKMWINANDRLNKSEHAVFAFTDVSLPRMLADVEKNFRYLRELKKEVKEGLDKKTDLVEFTKMKKSFQYEQDKLKEGVSGLTENNLKVSNYLDKFQPIEIWNSISQAIYKLSPKHLKNFVEFEEGKMSELKLNSETETNNIDSLISRSFGSFNEIISRRETMKVEIEKAEIEKASKSIRNGSSRRMYDSNEFKRYNKRRERNRYTQEPIEGFTDANKLSRSGSPTASLQVSENNEIKEVDEKSADVTKIEPAEEVKNIEDQTEYNQQEKNEECEKIEEKNEENLEKIEEKLTEKNLENQEEVLESQGEAFRNSEFNNFEENSFFGYQNEEYEQSEPRQKGFFDYPKVDLSQIESDISVLKQSLEEQNAKISSFNEYMSELDSIKEGISQNKTQLESFIQTVSVQLGNFQSGLSVNMSLMQEELKQMILRNKQEKTDLNKILSLYQSEQKSSISQVEKLDSSVSNLTDVLINFSEISKIIHLIISQEEDDRQSLQLLGYGESKLPKPYITLKADCMSCSGQSPTVLNAFKMACLNYSPSQVKYKNRTYTRKQIISVLGSLSSSALNQTLHRAPRYASELGSYQSIPSLAEEPIPQRHKYNRSQFIDLPSLNASKLFSEPDSQFNSTRDIKNYHNL